MSEYELLWVDHARLGSSARAGPRGRVAKLLSFHAGHAVAAFLPGLLLRLPPVRWLAHWRLPATSSPTTVGRLPSR
ncbi:hypothetical protein GCM10020219_073400 [Nonomuraea dietziae]